MNLSKFYISRYLIASKYKICQISTWELIFFQRIRFLNKTKFYTKQLFNLSRVSAFGVYYFLMSFNNSNLTTYFFLSFQVFGWHLNKILISSIVVYEDLSNCSHCNCCTQIISYIYTVYIYMYVFKIFNKGWYFFCKKYILLSNLHLFRISKSKIDENALRYIL